MKYYRISKEDGKREELTHERARFILEGCYKNAGEILEKPQTVACMTCLIEIIESEKAERLTIWNGRRWILKQGKASDGGSYWRMTTDKLAAYENTGLEPDEVARVIEDYKRLTGEAV